MFNAAVSAPLSLGGRRPLRGGTRRDTKQRGDGGEKFLIFDRTTLCGTRISLDDRRVTLME